MNEFIKKYSPKMPRNNVIAGMYMRMAINYERMKGNSFTNNQIIPITNLSNPF